MLVKFIRLIPLNAAFVALFFVGSVSAKPGWLTDFTEARIAAKAQKKLLVVDFTGSDWCGWCIKLDREVFAKPEFQEYARKNLVLLEIDFPRGKELPAAQKKQNEQFAMEQEIQGFPTVIVFDSEGRKVGILGYTAGGPAAFIAELDKLPKG